MRGSSTKAEEVGCIQEGFLGAQPEGEGRVLASSFYSELRGVVFRTGKRSFEELKFSPHSVCQESPEEATVVGQECK